MGDALTRHDALIRSAVDPAGLVFKTVGDSVCAAFQSPRDSLEAAIDAQRARRRRLEGNRRAQRAHGYHSGAADTRRRLFGGTVNRVSRVEAPRTAGKSSFPELPSSFLKTSRSARFHSSLSEVIASAIWTAPSICIRW
jgi:hypothetical protein